MRPKVFVVGRDPSVYALFHNDGWDVVGSIDDADLVQFTGGADINPSIYNQYKHYTTNFYPERDRMELLAYGYAAQLNKGMAGICRGAQLLNVLCGGDMWQNVDKHHQSHKMVDLRTKAEHMTSSIHHQMMIPGPNATIIATSKVSRVREKMSRLSGSKATLRNEGDDHSDPEIIWYQADKCFCFQGHPEYSIVPSVTPLYMDYIEEFFNLRGAS